MSLESHRYALRLKMRRHLPWKVVCLDHSPGYSPKRSVKRTASDSIAGRRVAISGMPARAADRKSLGLQSNSCRNARLKLDASSKQKSSAMAAIGRWPAGSDNNAQMRSSR
jgi:hypothetical protein